MTAGLSAKTASVALRDLEVLWLAEQGPEAVWRDIAWADLSRRPVGRWVARSQSRTFPERAAIARTARAAGAGTKHRQETRHLAPGRPAHHAQAMRARACQIRGPRRPVLAGHARRGRNALVDAARRARAFGDPRRIFDERSGVVRSSPGIRSKPP